MLPNHFSYTKVYTDCQEKSILSEFKRLQGQCYLEHAGATLYSEYQIADVLSDFNSNLYANPHARSTSSKVTDDSIDQVRYEILSHFGTNVDEYSVIFTTGCTAALKLVAETFDYQDGHFTYLQDNHTSVLGMREYAASIKPIRHDDAFEIFSLNRTDDKESSFNCTSNATKYPLSWIKKVQAGALNRLQDVQSKRWFCCLDAAAFVPTNELDLSLYKPDFVCLSFYKVFGYPTGLGALLVRNSSADVLIKKYYGGGTVLMAVSLENVAVPRKVLHERFEDGTLPFLSVLALKHGFRTLKRLKMSMETISQHTFGLAQYVYKFLSTLHHFNGKPVAVLYHDTNFEDRKFQGGIVNFNLLRPNEKYIGYSEKGHVCGDDNDLINGYPTGSVRISFGYMSTKRDADTFLAMIEDSFTVKPVLRKLPDNYEKIKRRFYEKFRIAERNGIGEDIIHTKIQSSIKTDTTTKLTQTSRTLLMKSSVPREVNNEQKIRGVLEKIFIYPVKSCAPFSVPDSWALASTGLKYDREWMIVNHLGVCLTQKRDANLCLVKPHVDLKREVLELHFKGMTDIAVPLTVVGEASREVFPCQSKVCGDHVLAWDCGDAVADWLSRALNKSGLRLLRQCGESSESRTKNKFGEAVPLSLANQAQFLLIGRSSIEWLSSCIPKGDFHDSTEDLIKRFRPNFVVNFKKRFVENELRELHFGDVVLQSNGQCTRCQMICIDQNTGKKSVEPLRTLSEEFGGKIFFGVYLKQEASDKCDDEIVLNSSVVGIY